MIVPTAPSDFVSRYFKLRSGLLRFGGITLPPQLDREHSKVSQCLPNSLAWLAAARSLSLVADKFDKEAVCSDEKGVGP
jgi:hypothetical protein